MHILYGGLRHENEHISSKYELVWTERFVFGNPPQKKMLPVDITWERKKLQMKSPSKFLKGF
jgi:hypothetical protein